MMRTSFGAVMTLRVVLQACCWWWCSESPSVSWSAPFYSASSHTSRAGSLHVFSPCRPCLGDEGSKIGRVRPSARLFASYLSFEPVYFWTGFLASARRGHHHNSPAIEKKVIGQGLGLSMGGNAVDLTSIEHSLCSLASLFLSPQSTNRCEQSNSGVFYWQKIGRLFRVDVWDGVA